MVNLDRLDSMFFYNNYELLHMNLSPKILIIGSTGELGSKLIKFCNSNKIKIHAITGYKNKKLKIQRKVSYKKFFLVIIIKKN